MLTGIHKPFHDLAGNAKTEVALHPRPYDAREAAFGSVTRAAVTNLTIGGSCLGSLTAEAACVRMESVTNPAAPNTAIRMLPSTIMGLFFMAQPHQIDCIRTLYLI